MNKEEAMNDLARRKQMIDLDRVTLLPFSGIHPIIKKSKQEYKKEFERGTFNEV